MSTLPALSRSLRFDPAKDLDYIGQVADVPMALVGKKNFASSNFRELQAHIMSNQKRINLANAGIGTASHLCGLMLMNRLKAPMTTIPYKGAAPAMTDLLGGLVDLLCDQITTTLQPILTGRVKPYGSTTRARLPASQDLPTLGEQGVPDFEVKVWHGVYAPRNLPKAVSERLVKALQDGVADTTFRESIQKLGALPVTQERASPEGLSTHLRNEVAKWSPLIKVTEAFIAKG